MLLHSQQHNAASSRPLKYRVARTEPLKVGHSKLLDSTMMEIDISL